MSDRRKLHERIAETFEPKPPREPWIGEGWKGLAFADGGNVVCPTGAWVYGPDKDWHALDYDTDEAANAMLLEAMPFVTLTKDDTDPDWTWAVVVDDPRGPTAYAKDRKIAIVNAYAKWKGIEVTRATCGEEKA